MATDGRSRRRWALRLLFLFLVAVPVVAPWVGRGADVLTTVDAATTLEAVGLGMAVFVILLLGLQKRRSRGQRSGSETVEQSEPKDGRRVEGSGEAYAPYAYNNQQQARREGRRIRDRAAEVAEADREARKR